MRNLWVAACFGGVFALGIAGCASTSGDEGVVASESGLSSNPFDADSCNGSAMTEAQARALFPEGASHIPSVIESLRERLLDVVVGDYVIQKRTRSCNTAAGCTPWAQSERVNSIVRELSGQVHLRAVADHVQLDLGGASVCSQVGVAQECTPYLHGTMPQWVGNGEFSVSERVLKEDSRPLALRGVLTGSCVRLVDTAQGSPNRHGDYAEEEYVLYAKLRAGRWGAIEPRRDGQCPAFTRRSTCFSPTARATCCRVADDGRALGETPPDGCLCL